MNAESDKQYSGEAVLRENYLRLEQVAIRESMCVYLPSLELSVPVKMVVDNLLFAPLCDGEAMGMRKAIIYTKLLDKLEKHFTTRCFQDTVEAFGLEPNSDYRLMHPDVYAAHEIYKKCYPTYIEFRPDKELEKEKI